MIPFFSHTALKLPVVTQGLGPLLYQELSIDSETPKTVTQTTEANWKQSEYFIHLDVLWGHLDSYGVPPEPLFQNLVHSLHMITSQGK